MINLQNRYVKKLALLLMASFGCFQLARADIDLACTGQEANSNNGATVTYHTGSGVTADQGGTGTYGYGPDGNPGHQSFYATTNVANSNSATTTIDTSSGQMRGRSEGHQATAGTTDQMTEQVFFHNGSSQPAAATIHWHVDGTLSVGGSGGRAGYTAVLQFYSGAAGGSFVLNGNLDTNPSQNSDTYSTDGWDDPGESYQVQHNPGGLYGYNVTATVVLPAGDSTWQLYARLSTGMNGYGGFDSFGLSDFSNTAALTFTLPPEITFTSASGQLLTGITAVSRKNQGGTDYDISLPLTGMPGIECRQGPVAGEYQIVVSFANPINQMGMVTADSPAQVQSSSLTNGTVVTVNLTNVPNQQTTHVTLHDVHNGAINGDVVVPLSVLIGDVNGNGGLTNADVSVVKAQVAAGGNVSPTNFRNDVNANGAITNADISLIKAQVAAGAQLH